MSAFASPLQPLHQGMLQTRRGEAVRLPYTLRFLGPDDLERLEIFRVFIFGLLPDPDAYVPETPDFTGLHLGERGVTLGVEVEGELVACSVVGMPHPGMPAFVDDLPGDPPGERPAVTATAHMASCMVHPDFRGNGMQRLLVAMRAALALGAGRPHLLSRVALTNPLSLANMLACGFTVRRVLVMHGTRLRYLLHRDMSAAPASYDPDGDLVLAVADKEGQDAALASGHVGRAARMENGRPFVVYSRPLADAPSFTTAPERRNSPEMVP